MTTLTISNIFEGKRHRHDLGNIKSLAESMTEVGQLQPIVVTPALKLVAGARRLAAARSLGWTEIEAVVVRNLRDAASLLRAEADENVCRKAFTPTEAAAIAAEREVLLKPIAKAASAANLPNAQGGNLPPQGKVRETAAQGLGYSPTTIRKVRDVQRKVDAPDTPEPVREAARTALVEMDKTGNVDRAHKAVAKAEAAVNPTDNPAAIAAAARREYLTSPWPVFEAKLLADLKRWGDWLKLAEVGGVDGLLTSLGECPVPGMAGDQADSAVRQIDNAVAWLSEIREALAAPRKLRRVQ